MNKSDIFLWGIQPLIIGATNLKSWDKMRAIKVAIVASGNIPLSFSAEDAIEMFFHYIVEMERNPSVDFRGW